MGMTLDYRGRGECQHKVLMGGRRRVSVRDGRGCIAARMEEGPRAQDAVPPEAGRGWKRFSLEPPEGAALPTSGVTPQPVREWMCHFRTPTLVVICDNSHRKQIRCPGNAPELWLQGEGFQCCLLVHRQQAGASQRRGWHLTGLCRMLRNLSRPRWRRICLSEGGRGCISSSPFPAPPPPLAPRLHPHWAKVTACPQVPEA